ncbi:MAG: Npt1/Npt2 family nucleotide transporter [Desulfobacterales bacterium]|nr:Npt1/Npt2 family nucleotide transporter [Desulfobacterales bacterium]
MAPENQGAASPSTGRLRRTLTQTIHVKPDELRALVWSCIYFFCILSAYYVIRPIRDEMGVAGGVKNLPWLFTGTLLGMVALNPPFAALVTKLPRLRFVSITYRFFMANLLIFFLLLQATTGSQHIWAGRIFYMWTAIFNLFVVSVFWGFMADMFTSSQGGRLFGLIGAGGTLGAILGSSITAISAQRLGTASLLLVSIFLLELAVRSVHQLSKSQGRSQDYSRRATSAESPIGGKILSGLTKVWQSPYLLGICAYMLLYTILSTFLYFEQATIVGQAYVNRAARTALFAKIDLWVNILTLFTQIFLTGRIVKVLGVALTLTVVPTITLIGFTSLGAMPALIVVVIFQVFRRAGSYAVVRPVRELLFTVVPREDKYKSKNFIDTFVYRLGDQIGAWTSGLLVLMGLSVAGIALAALPLSVLWMATGFWLGRKQEARAAETNPAK